MRFLFKALISALLIPALLAAAAWWYVNRPLTLDEPVVEFTVERGYNMRQAANAIVDAGVQESAELLYWTARVTGFGDRIVAGSYAVGDGDSVLTLLRKLYEGDVTFGQMLIVEGWTFNQVRQVLETHPHLQPDTIGLSDEEVLSRIGAEEAHPEGLFYPDTYRFDRHSSALAVLQTAYRAMQQRLAQAWEMRDPNLPLDSAYEALIMASIIEKETGHPDERTLVSSVFANRLNIGMRLQTDPTVIYGFGDELEGRLRRRHLETDHEYNTYTRAGLPPTPIAMPGWDSLVAAVQPAASDYLYFVARGDGTSEFSRTLREHNRAVNIYIRGRGG